MTSCVISNPRYVRNGDPLGDRFGACDRSPPPCPALWTCRADGDQPRCSLEPAPVAASRETFEAITASLAQEVSLPDRAEDTMGSLALGLHPYVVPIVRHPKGTVVAASYLGAGRVVAFAGQDFLSSGSRSTLVDDAVGAPLLANAVRWARRDRAGRILVDNDAVRIALERQGVTGVDVVPSRGEVRDWSIDLSPYAAIAVQINEWGTARIDVADLDHLRAFVSGGGGLLISGSATHWSWWLPTVALDFPGTRLLEGAGIAWNLDTFRDLARSDLGFDELSPPLALWNAYVGGAPIREEDYARLPGLFASAPAAGIDLTPGLDRLLRESPDLPAPAAAPAARLAAEVIATLPPMAWPTPHPWARVFPGEVPPEAPRIEREIVAVDARWIGLVPLGLYAPPGEVIAVRLRGNGPRGLGIQIGEQHDNLLALPEIARWERAPITARTFPVSEPELTVGAPLGGSMYVVFPDDAAPTSRPLELEISGAVRQPYYVAGKTLDWPAARAAPAPQAILEVPGKIRLAVDASAIGAGAQPAAILRYWEGFYDSHFELSQEPTPRRRASHLIFDPQVGVGYANSIRERMNYPKLSQVWALRRELDREDIWLFGHELGHQFQTEDWTGGGITEVAVNLFTMYTLNHYRNGGGDRETRGHRDNRIDHAALKALRWPTADLFQRLDLYRQLVFEFGWSKFREVFASYYSPRYSPERDGRHLDGFAIRFSKVVRRDLTGFFDHWQYPLSDAARAAIRELGYAPWLPPGW